MGNTIKTGLINIGKSNNTLSIGSYSLNNKLPSSVYQFGIVFAINTNNKSIIYRLIEDNVATQKKGTAFPLYPNKIQLPGLKYVVPLLRAPDIDISTLNGQYSKNVYYLDPIGMWQTVNDNSIDTSSPSSNIPKETNISKQNINQALIGIPNINS
jgi:hypothetical protein